MPQCIIELTALYTNYTHTGLGDQPVLSNKAEPIVLATHLKQSYKQAAKKPVMQPCMASMTTVTARVITTATTNAVKIAAGVAAAA